MTLEDILFVTIVSILIILALSKLINSDKKEFIVNSARSILPLLIIVFLFRAFLFEPFRIPSGSMKPTLIEGDFIAVNKFKYGLYIPIVRKKIFNFKKITRGDVVVFKHANGKNFIKRIIGLPGDKIKCKNEKIYINNIYIAQVYKGKTLNEIKPFGNIRHYEEKINHNRHYSVYMDDKVNADGKYIFTDIVVPKGKYFVIGDNRNNSEDSRYWGFVKKTDILGEAFIIWCSIDFSNIDIRWSRFVNKII